MRLGSDRGRSKPLRSAVRGGRKRLPSCCRRKPACESLGYQDGFSTNTAPPIGIPTTYNLPCNGTVTVTSDGVNFDWSSTIIGMDAVIAKGGPNANLYVYDPPAESFGDTGLHSPNNASGQPAGLSHVVFCFDHEVTVEKTAETSFTRTWTWTIDKVCPPDTDLTLAPGETYTAAYSVTVDATSEDSACVVSGTITISNPSCNPDAVEITESLTRSAA